MISLLLALVLIGVVVYLVGLIPMDAAILQVIRVVAIVLAVLICLQFFGLFDSGLGPRWRR